MVSPPLKPLQKVSVLDTVLSCPVSPAHPTPAHRPKPNLTTPPCPMLPHAPWPSLRSARCPGGCSGGGAGGHGRWERG